MYYVIVSDWCIDYEAGHRIIGVYTTELDAIKALKIQVDAENRKLAEMYGYYIYEDNDNCFDSGIEGEYISNHIYVGIETVDQEVDLPPVKIGDEVYFAYEWLEQICRGTVSMLQQKADKSWKFRVSHGSSVSDYPISAIGKTVFLTYAEAERCLADMEV